MNAQELERLPDSLLIDNLVCSLHFAITMALARAGMVGFVNTKDGSVEVTTPRGTGS